MNDSLQALLVIYAVATLGCYVVSIITKNYSQVDRLWSIMPPVYVGYLAFDQQFSNPRVNVMFALVTLWGARLTYNFARKGGYKKGGEDYRWPVLRERLGPVKFQLFNATFISPYQHFLLLLISLPAWVAHTNASTVPFGAWDAVVALLFMVLLIGETVADQQQWNFHLSKHAQISRGEKPTSRFLQTGLFRFSRHPNFFCEQGMWWCIYGFSVIATGQALQYGLVGAVLLTLLFQGSTAFTEKLTLQKYPEYKEYQRTTSRLIPMPR